MAGRVSKQLDLDQIGLAWADLGRVLRARFDLLKRWSDRLAAPRGDGRLSWLGALRAGNSRKLWVDQDKLWANRLHEIDLPCSPDLSMFSIAWFRPLSP
jgi:hypothetical protein